MAALSGVTPTWVTPLEPMFHNIVTESESQKKNFMNFSGSTPIFRYRLQWTNLSDTKFWTLHKHYYDQKGGYSKFVWKDVPTYIDTDMNGTVDGSDITVRYVDGSFSFKPNAKTWNAEVVVEKEVT